MSCDDAIRPFVSRSISTTSSSLTTVGGAGSSGSSSTGGPACGVGGMSLLAAHDWLRVRASESSLYPLWLPWLPG